MPDAHSPDRILTVSQLNGLAAGALKKGVGPVWVRGEVTGLKVQSSGHMYCSLKDAQSVLQVAVFRGVAVKVGRMLAEGKQVLIFGELDIYAPRGSYQLIAQFVLEEGAGRLQQEMERLKKQLEAEGLFAPERKIAIPRLPEAVAFVTSPTGAVWQDFAQILTRRGWKGRAVLVPCRVQGAEAPAELVAALKKADELPGVELVVVGRGGGSLEDLWAFNDERVVRAVAAMRRPVISAVGHQTDVTLTDWAADLRAETPSAAAELIAGYFLEALAQVESLGLWLRRAAHGAVGLAKERLAQLRVRLAGRSPRGVLQSWAQRLDELEERMGRAARGSTQLNGQKLQTLQARLAGLDPAVTLKRGYALVKDEDGKLVTRAEEVTGSGQLQITWADGQKRVQVR